MTAGRLNELATISDVVSANPDGGNSEPAGAASRRDAIRLREALGLSNRDARSEVELLLMHALRISRARLIAHPQLAAQAAGNHAYLESLRRRLGGEPIAYILGEREFYARVFKVSPDVLIPRPETELLVDAALARIERRKQVSVLDLGTGSGAIAIAIAWHCPNVKITAIDASQAALDIAVSNSKRLLEHCEQVRFVQSDWFKQIASEHFDMIVSNPPYVAVADRHLDSGDVRFEPRQALVGGRDGFDHLRTIIGQAPRYLADGGWLLFEHGYDQAAGCRELIDQAGFCDAVSECDLAGHSRVAGGRRLTGAAGTG